MKTEFSRQYLIDNCGCYDEESGKIEGLLGDRIIVTLNEILESEIPLEDKCWFVANSCELSKSEVKQLLLKLTRIVLPIFEEEYPDDTRVRECIIATEGFLNGTVTKEELNNKRRVIFDVRCAVANAAYYASSYDACGASYYAAIAAAGKLDYEQKILNELKKLN
jgi:hypothetical protein